MATNEVHLTIDFQNVEIVKKKFEETLQEITRLRELLNRISNYESSNDDKFDFKMLQVIASVGLLEGLEFTINHNDKIGYITYKVGQYANSKNTK
jgi:hypothetical protein